MPFQKLKKSQPGLSKPILKPKKDISTRLQGRERFCNANPKKLQEVTKWLKFYEQFWDDKLSGLGDYLDGKV